MPVSVTCPCGKRLRVPDENVGKRIKCPSCGATQLVKAEPPSDAPAAPPIAPVQQLVSQPSGTVPSSPQFVVVTQPREEPKKSGFMAKVIGGAFAAVVAPVLVALGVKYLSPKEDSPGSSNVQEDKGADKDKGQEKSKTLFAFNGKDLSGFYTYSNVNGRDKDPKKVFSVQDDLLRISGEDEGTLLTQKDYDQYRLVLEYKWGEKTWGARETKARTCELFFHAAGPDGKMYGTKCWIGEGRTGDLAVVHGELQGNDRLWLEYYLNPKPEGKDTKLDMYKFPITHVFRPGGMKCDWFGQGPTHQINWDPQWKDEKGFRSKSEIEKPTGEWNTLELTCSSKSIGVDLNGTRVNAAGAVPSPPNEKRPFANKGKICFISRGAEIILRKIEVISLKP
jgi:hypothetical protein